MRTIAVVQARMGSSRLPGKVLEPILGQPLILWTLAAVHATAGVDDLVVATTKEPADDPLVEVVHGAGVRVHRGPTDDVLRRVVDAATPLAPDAVLRQTADNPFADPEVMGGQVAILERDGHDYVGVAGWPYGIAAEVVRLAALLDADRDAAADDEREHVTLFVRRRPTQFRILAGTGPAADGASAAGRFTVDAASDLEAARRIAEIVGHEPPLRLAELRAALLADPAIADLNRDVSQNPLSAQPASGPAATEGLR